MRGTVLRERANSSCFADDQGFQAANGNVSEAVSIRTIPAGKGLEKNCISTVSRRCIHWVPVPDHWWELLGCGWAWPRAPRAPTACMACREHEGLTPSVLGPQVCDG